MGVVHDKENNVFHRHANDNLNIESTRKNQLTVKYKLQLFSWWPGEHYSHLHYPDKKRILQSNMFHHSGGSLRGSYP